jgi:ABC-type nitrate/sulfonate/bicarbonate transport system substrate-binding protein
MRGGGHTADAAVDRPARDSMALALLVLCILALAIGTACTASQNPPAAAKKANFAMTRYPGSAALYVARDKGFFRDEGVDPTFTVYPSGVLALAAVIDGSADFATCAETPIARAALDGKPLAVVATLARVQRSNLIVARRDKGVASAGDLKGKRVGLAKSSAADFLLHIYLIASGIDPKGVEVVYMKPDEVVGALTSGRVEAVCTWPPYTTKLISELGDGAVVLDSPGLYTLKWNVSVRRDLTSRDPDLIVRFLRAVAKADDYIAEHPDEARSITAKAVGVDTTTIKAMWNDYRMSVMLDQSLLLSLEDEARWMRASESTRQPGIPNFLEYVYTGGLRAVRPANVRIVE